MSLAGSVPAVNVLLALQSASVAAMAGVAPTREKAPSTPAEAAPAPMRNARLRVKAAEVLLEVMESPGIGVASDSLG
jgi:hypothetical protein